MFKCNYVFWQNDIFNLMAFSDEFEEAEIEECEDGVRTKSIFVKVPLKGTSPSESALFKSFNERELTMLTEVLPKLQTFLDDR